MNLTTLLGRKLKDDEIVKILEAYQIEQIIYDFDRHHENMEDVYWAAAKTAGFQLRFDQCQVVDTIFCYVAAEEGFSPISPQIIGVPVYRSFDEAEGACKSAGLVYSVSDPKNGPRFHKLWLRIESPERQTHYQFKGGAISRITLMRSKL
jgi:hypothetical protein